MYHSSKTTSHIGFLHLKDKIAIWIFIGFRTKNPAGQKPRRTKAPRFRQFGQKPRGFNKYFEYLSYLKHMQSLSYIEFIDKQQL